MSVVKTVQEMDLIRKKDAIIQERLLKERQNKVAINTYKDGITLIVSRCIDGPCLGMFQLEVLISEDENGKPLKKPLRKKVIEGVDRDSLNRSFDKSVGKRYFR